MPKISEKRKQQRNVPLATFILYRLGNLKISQTQIASEARVSLALANYVIWGTAETPRVRAIILKLLGYRNWEELEKAASEIRTIVKQDGKLS